MGVAKRAAWRLWKERKVREREASWDGASGRGLGQRAGGHGRRRGQEEWKGVLRRLGVQKAGKMGSWRRDVGGGQGIMKLEEVEAEGMGGESGEEGGPMEAQP